MLTSSGGGRSMLTVADRGEGGIKFAKILLTSYVNAPLRGYAHLRQHKFFYINYSIEVFITSKLYNLMIVRTIWNFDLLFKIFNIMKFIKHKVQLLKYDKNKNCK